MDRWIGAYAEFKQALNDEYGISESLAHVHAGLIIFFFAALVFRSRMRSKVPIALVYLFAFANELIDWVTHGDEFSAWNAVADIANTVVWPSLLVLLARRKIKESETTQS